MITENLRHDLRTETGLISKVDYSRSLDRVYTLDDVTNLEFNSRAYSGRSPLSPTPKSSVEATTTITAQAFPTLTTDILWRNYSTGVNAYWEMDGFSSVGHQNFTPVPDLNWQLRGAGNFNDDDHHDLVWQNLATGETAIWLMNGTAITSSPFLLTVPDLNWRIVAAASFDNDDQTDILWQHQVTGESVVWLMNGTSVVSGQPLAVPTDPAWQMQAVADFNGDGETDIFVHNQATGVTQIWLMSNTTLSTIETLDTVLDFNWESQGAGDFDYDGDADIFWRNTATGQNVVWQLDGARPEGHTFLETIPELNWRAVVPFQFRPADLGGNTPGTAFDIGTLNGTVTYNDEVGVEDAIDYYRFNLASPGDVSLWLTNLSADADVRLFHDANGNNLIDGSEQIDLSDAAGTTDEVMTLNALAAGTYFVEIYPFGGSDTPYTLHLSNSSPSALLPTEIDLGAISSTQTRTGTVSDKNTTDTYRFTVGGLGQLNVALTGLSNDADVRLIRDLNGNGIVDAGEEVARSQRNGTTDEAINLRSLASDTYFLQVYQFNGNSNYTLNLSTTSPSNLLPTEVNIGTLTGAQTFANTISDTNTADIYRFSLTDAATVAIDLTNLSANANLRLLRDSNNNGVVDIGDTIATSARFGTLPENLTQSLQAGTYFVQVYQGTGTTGYSLTLGTTAPITDGAGNTLPTARDIGVLSTTQTFNDFVGTPDPNDYYRFSLDSVSSVNLSLTGLSADADMQLIQDANNNGVVDFGDVIAYPFAIGPNPENLTISLASGTYFVRVFQFSGDTNYTLTASAALDTSDNTLANAQDMGVLSTAQTFTDFVGSTDLTDYYRFTLNDTNSVNLSLTGLSADADMMLIQDANNNGLVDAGEVLAYPWQDGTAPENLTIGLDAGTYFVRVFPFSVSTNYTLTASATPIVVPPGYDLDYGYGLVDAAAAIAQALGSSPFADVPNLGGDNWGLDMVRAPEVWANGYTGAGIVVAVVDSGVDYNHLDLNDNIWVNTDEIAGNGIDDDNNGYIDDIRGWDFVGNDNSPLDLSDHGTHVAGTIAAENNGVGVTGVAYDAQIMPVRVLDASGSGTYPDVADGIRYAVDNGADVVNLSLGGGFSSDVEAAVQYAIQQGVVVVMASGNESAGQPGFPAYMSDEFGLAVGAVNSSNGLANFSNDAGFPVVNYVVAPGVGVRSTIPGNSYASFSGTSMATPHVAGVVALLLDANPNLTPAQVVSLLTDTANPDGITT